MKDILRIFSYLGPYRRLVALHVLFTAASVIFALFSFAMVIPFLEMLFGLQNRVQAPPTFNLDFETIKAWLYHYLGAFVDEYGKTNTLAIVAMAVVVMTLFKTGFTYLSMWVLAPIRSGVVRDLRNQLYRKLLGMHLGYFSDERKGDLMSRITNDVAEIEWSILSGLEAVFRSPIAIVFYLASLIFIDIRLTFFILILIPIAGFFIGLLGRTLRKTSMEAQSSLGIILSAIEETLGGLRIVKAFNAEGRMMNSFLTRNENFTSLMTRIFRRRYLATPLTEFLATIVVAVTMWFGGMLVLGSGSHLDPEDLITYLILFSQIIPPAKSFSTAHYNIQKGLASVDRVNEVLDAQRLVLETPHPINKQRFEHSLEFRDVSFSYGNGEVLNNINLKIEKGQTVALVGQSGAGKSTLADLIPRFHDPVQGQILLDGIPLTDLVIKDLRSLMGIVSQESILFNDTIFNNISFGKLNATASEVERAAHIAHAMEFIEMIPEGFLYNIGDRGARLSGGQKQRLSIARAILKDPPILILDEATSSLDSESEKLVQEALIALMKDRTSVVIAHRLSTIKKADLIVVLDKGRIVEQGSHEDLLKQGGVYRNLYEMQMFA
jgi:ATP-binding cassette, subfamily B, bacterial MsbA